MPAKRPETRTGSRNAAPRGAVHAAAAGWLLGAACLILCATPSMGRAASAPARPEPASASKTSATSTTPVGKSTVSSTSTTSKPAPTAAGKLAGGSDGTGATESTRSATDSTFGARDAGAPGAAAGARPASSAVAPATAKGARPAPVATTSPVRPARAPAGATPAGPTPARLAASNAGRTRGVQTVAHLDQKLTYQYNALGRRDPFQPMIGGEFVGVDVGGDAPVDVGGMKVVGIVWGTEDKFAMAEDGRGQSLVLRAGDKVMNGVVESLRRDAVVVRITTDGQTQTVAIPLTRKGDKSNATR